QNAFRGIEKNNPALFAIFGDAQWTNKTRMPDRVLLNLIEHFSSINFGLENIPQDKLGEAYEYLIKQFADDSGHTAAEFYTNRTLVSLMTEILDPQPEESVYDPTCGSGGMLLVAALHLAEQEKEYRNLKLYGQEINLITSAIAKMNLYLHGIEDFLIVRGDTLANPAFVEGDELKKFNVILANPPYSIKKWDQKAWSKDKWGRNIWGTPPKGRADYAFYQHIVKSLDEENGRCAILYPHGVLFRDEEYEMRKKLIQSDIIDCVIGLGPNLFYNSPMEACVIFCTTNKPNHKKGKILFINALDEIKQEAKQSFLEKEHIKKIAEAYRNFEDKENFCRIVNVNEIKEKDWNLAIIRYVKLGNNNADKDERSLSGIIKEWDYYARQSNEEMDNFLMNLKEVGIIE
ncbi:MAG: hypothetical protein HeimC2_21930, partial [Candidatus Heimdallarchaeota archaeon LC_2]